MDRQEPPHRNEGASEHESYEVFCLNCGDVFDACHSQWCACITDVPTLVCPHCERCFCTASPEERQRFWESAPPSLWQKHLSKGSHAGAEPPTEHGNPVRRPLILVADDDPGTLRIAYRVIESLGYGVLLAKDGEEAFELAKKYKPDLVLSDQMMPHMDGRHLCRKIKENPRTKHMVVLLMTGLYKKESHRVEAMRDYEADDYLVKPVAFDKLGEVLEAWLTPSKPDR